MSEGMAPRICPACFQSMLSGGVCPSCGYGAVKEPEQPLALPHYSFLHRIYQTGRVLGVGGFGITYVARNVDTGMLCCIKEYVPEEMAVGRDAYGNLQIRESGAQEFARGKERFLEEARILRQFQGNVTVVNIWDFFEQNGTAYFTMEYLDGCNMRVFQRSHTDRREELKDKALQMLLSVGSALMEVHRFGLIHGDISPENIILTESGEIKLIDFGAARTWRQAEKQQGGRIFLKSGYAPYEQHLLSGRIGPWTDVYALAATYYALVTGRKIPDARERVKEDAYIPLGSLCSDIDPAFTKIIDAALTVDYRDRYQSMKEFLDAVAKVLPQAEVKKEEKKQIEEPVQEVTRSDVMEETPPVLPVSEPEPQPVPKKKGFHLFGGGRKKEPKREARIYLEMYTRAGSVRSWALQRDVTYTVGRHPASQIVLPPDDRLSRNHCTMRYNSRMKSVQLTDYSSIGTYRENGTRLPKGIESTVRVGEYFYMSVPEFRFRVVED
ncbi:MAG: FHA domain-containing serine/threonine-protein kinase [Lachnospiraceae bacterium]|nr:FHA domain-containing serine/threonine-protein kinase [Lachnospiraceae bacterium]